MKTIAENLQIIKDSIEAIKQAIIDKGGTVNGNITTYANAIRNLENNFDDNGHNYKVVFLDDTVIDPRNTITKITIPAKIKIIGPEAFAEYHQLQSVYFENDSELTIIEYDAFLDCSSLTTITIPEGVTKIGTSAFEGCSSLTSINIPASVTSIGDYAFHNCQGLTGILCEAVVPPGVNWTTFGYVDKSIPLYVPADSGDAYRAEDGWKDFTDIRATL